MQWPFLCAYNDAQNWKLHGYDTLIFRFIFCMCTSENKFRPPCVPAHSLTPSLIRVRCKKVLLFAFQYTFVHYNGPPNEINVEITCLAYNLIHYTVEHIYLYVNSYATIKMIMERGNFSLSLLHSFHFFSLLEC